MLDKIFSMVVGTIMILSIQALIRNMNGSASDQSLNSIVQSNLLSVTNVIEDDFRKMGYNVSVPADSCIRYADSSTVIFKGDVDNNGMVDSLRYSLGPSTRSGNLNPHTRLLYRRFNNSEGSINLGITRFLFTYYDAAGNKMASVPSVAKPSLIRSIKVTLNIESIMPSKLVANDTTYSCAAWEQLFKPRNLR